MDVTDFLPQVMEILDEISDDLTDMNAVFQLELKNTQTETYQLKITAGKSKWAEGTPFAATCTIKISVKDFRDLMQGKMNPTVALLTGKVKIQGDRKQLQKLQSILKKHYRDVPEIF
ncbi:SCP2 sterol-binding domain-containing protein [Dethiobacter alkaliphilus]|uniref:Sterol-binding domain protein n=1 Tax=Dethiobacter alkaliphilus AHT 1 TaxID=555088 RepID=C0GER6_DETAL|nr:SCP2 sterol-binding domain-containing protein [Dethiobacter alkaliphilus]EEG78098.1 Sterol-binding domain protein [Dethiobacter alkaliphilus AHT 1]